MNIEFINQETLNLINFIKEAPSWLSGLVIFFSSAIEYVFPPFPGDVVTVAGGFFAARGAIPLCITFPALLLGSLAGASLSWRLGVLAAHHANTHNYVARFVSPKNMLWLQIHFKRYGTLLIAGNRFLPMVRGVIMFVAGLSGTPYQVLIKWSVLSALLWNSALVFLGYFVSEKFEHLLFIVQSYSQIVIGLMVVVGLVWIISKLFNRKKH